MFTDSLPCSQYPFLVSLYWFRIDLELTKNVIISITSIKHYLLHISTEFRNDDLDVDNIYIINKYVGVHWSLTYM